MKLVMTKGLPGSGKTTWAKEQLKKGNWKRVNKDDLRRMLDDGKWSGKNEKFVLKARDALITILLDEEQTSVIVDDTNLHPKHETFLRDVAKRFGAEFEIKDFTDVPIEKCIENDLKRFDSVGEKVIRKMYKDFLAPKPQVQEWDNNKDTTIICDLDGTLALFEGNPYKRDFSKDQPNNVVRSILMKYEDTFDITLLSGRTDEFKQVTEEWLKTYRIPYTSLHMRKTGDDRKDSIIKEELYEEFVKPHYNVAFVLDDRDQVVDLWRSLGLTCLQVAPGEF